MFKAMKRLDKGESIRVIVKKVTADLGMQLLENFLKVNTMMIY